MLHIILMILKILGILILSILGIVLCIALLILFCPIRYELESSIYGKIEGRIRISWLLRLVCATLSYKESQLECKLCILGIRLKRKKKESQMESEVEETEGEKKGRGKRFLLLKRLRIRQRFGKKKVSGETGQGAGQEEPDQGKAELLQKKETKQDKKQIKEGEFEEKSELKEDKKEVERKREQKEDKKEREEKKEQKENNKEIEGERETTKRQQTEESDIGEKDHLQGGAQEEDLAEQKDIPEEADKRKNLWQPIKAILSKIKNIPEKIKGIWLKVKEILIKIRGIPDKVKGILFTIKDKIQKFLALLKDLNKKKQTILAFIKDEKNKVAFRYAGGKMFRFLRYILPRKVILKLHYGFEDPAVTGQLTGMIFMLYPESAEKFQLMPDFEKQVLEGELMIKGRVRFIRVLCTLLSIYFHRECNRIIKMIIKR